MRQSASHLALGLLILASGCGGTEARGPGRFPHAVIFKTVAPWDGPATCLYLCEVPPTRENGLTKEPRVSFTVYEPGELSGKRIRLDGSRSRTGEAVWIDGDRTMTPLTHAAIDFGDVRPDSPVMGVYDVTLPDGRRERGRFEAAWWPAAGPGG